MPKLIIPMIPFPIEMDFDTYLQQWSNPRWMIECEEYIDDPELYEKLKEEQNIISDAEFSGYLKAKTNYKNYIFQARKLIRKEKLLKIKQITDHQRCAIF